MLSVADPGFPRQGRQPFSLVQGPKDFCRKLHENEKIWTERGRLS